MRLQGQSSIWKRSSFSVRIGQVCLEVPELSKPHMSNQKRSQLIQQNGIFHVSHTIETVVTYLAMNDSQRHTLQEEVAAVWRDNPEAVSSWHELAKLPYLTACINEGMR